MVVQGEPAVQHLHNLRLEDLGDGKLAERLLSQDLVVLELLGPGSKLLRILSRVGHLAEDILRICHVLDIAHNIG